MCIALLEVDTGPLALMFNILGLTGLKALECLNQIIIIHFFNST